MYIIDGYMSRDLNVPGLDFMSQGLTGVLKLEKLHMEKC